MPISQSDQLFKLVKSLTKAEKRNFRIYAGRIQDGNSMKYIHLFDLLDKQSSFDERAINKKIPKAQLPNLKRHLYSQILISLRLLHRKKNVTIEIRELMDFAQILYGKGLYLSALKICDKAKTLASKNHDDLSYLNILEFEKIIESRHITRTGPAKTKEKLDLASQKLENVSTLIRLTNLKIYLHGLYIKYGHIKSEEQRQKITNLFEENIDKIPLTDLNVIEKVSLYQSFVWYYYILIDFYNCYRYALRWVDLLKDSPENANRDMNLLLRGYHYLLTSAYNTLDHKNFNKYHDELEAFRKENYKRFNPNTQIISFLYAHHGRFNRYFLSGEFNRGLQIIPKTLRRISRYESKLDIHQVMVFYFKIAWMYLGANQPAKAIKYLNKIMVMEIGVLRPDIQGYARIMHLMAHYDMNNFDILDYLVRNADSFFKKLKEANKLQRQTMDFFKEIVKIGMMDRSDKFASFRNSLEIISMDKYEGKAFLYLDILSWIISKVEKKPLAEVIKIKTSPYWD